MKKVNRYFAIARKKGSPDSFVETVVKAGNIKEAKEILKEYEIKGKIKKSKLLLNAI